MTAEEILHSKYFSDQIPAFNESGIIEAMKEYAKLKCEEQRKICANKCDEQFRYDVMINAAPPKFD